MTVRVRSWSPIAAIALCGLACTAGLTDAEKRGPQSVIVILLDTLRADHLELYGYATATAPFLARMGAEGVVFTSAFSTSTWTCPSTASLFTGLYPSRSGVTSGFFAQRNRSGDFDEMELRRLPDSIRTLPERFKYLGYRTFGVGANVNIGAEVGFDRGFDRFVKLHNASAEEIFAQLLRWEREMKSGDPFFLYVHFNDIHGPYKGRAPWYRGTGEERTDIPAAYDSEIRYTDGVIEKIVQRFDPAGTGLFVALSDHGEEFWDHGALGHGFTLHYELNRIVWLLHAPTLGIGAKRQSTNVSIVDVAPTLVELAGGAAEAGDDGRSLVPLLRRDDRTVGLQRELDARTVYAHRAHRHDPEQQLWSATQGRWKIIRSIEGERLYDLAIDTAEHNDVAALHPDIVSRLSESINALRAAETVAGEKVAMPLEPDMIEHLRALGYVEE